MEIPIFDALKGLTISEMNLEAESAFIKFKDGSMLAIYNNFTLINEAQAASLIGSCLREVKETDIAISLIFENKLELIIDLRDEAYNGPEALQLDIPGKPIMVWN